MVLGVLLPVATLGIASLVTAAPPGATPRPPERSALTTSTLVCPSATERTTQVGVASTEPEVSGEVTVGGAEPLAVASGSVAETDRDDAVVLSGADTTAPGLVASRIVAPPLAAAGCAAPDADVWFTGVGAAARRASVLELVNPDAGAAVVDVSLHSGRGIVDAPELRGLTVPGGETLRVDLAERVPRRGELALHVVTARGRATAFVESRDDPLGRGGVSRDWVPAQTTPAEDLLLLGVPDGAGERTLTIANPGDDEVRAQVRFVTDDSVFAPDGLEEVRVPAQGVARVALAGLLTGAGDVLGLGVEASGPVTATLRSVADGDLALTVPGSPLEDPTALVVPAGEKRLLLAGADSTGAVSYVARSADGEKLAGDRVEIAPDRGLSIKLPRGAVLVELTQHGTTVVGAVLAAAAGSSTVLPLSTPQRELLVPDVRPGLP